jgi:hypothetical protein
MSDNSDNSDNFNHTHIPQLQVLEYPDISDNSHNQYTNVLLVDKSVIDYSIFVNSANQNTFPIVYSSNSYSSELLSLLRQKRDAGMNILRIGLCFGSSTNCTVFFLDNSPFFTTDEIAPSYSQNVRFMIDLINEFAITTIDFLACNTLLIDGWKNYYTILSQNTGVMVGASDNTTGNIKYGGDWIMESTSENIENIYFTQNIQYYKYLLDNANWVIAVQSNLIGIATDDTYLYVGKNYDPVYGNSGAIARIEIANPSNIILRWVNTSTYGIKGPWALDVYGGFLYVGNNTTGSITRISLTDPTTNYTVHWASKPVQGISNINNIVAYDNYMYVACGNSPNRITKISITNPTVFVVNWATVSQGITAPPIGLRAYNGYMYVLCSNGVICKISITNPTTDFSANFFTTSNSINLNNIVVLDDYLYVSFFSTGKIGRIHTFRPNDVNLNWGSLSTGISGLVVSNYKLYVCNFNQNNVAQLDLPPRIACFHKDTRILTNKGYTPVYKLCKGDLVLTYANKYVPVYSIKSRSIYHDACSDNIKNQLYVCSKSKYPELFEDLIITGSHSILVNRLTQEQRDRMIELFDYTYITDNNYRLPVCIDERASVHALSGEYVVYHFALENKDFYSNYGVYANGLLVETASKRFMSELF